MAPTPRADDVRALLEPAVSGVGLVLEQVHLSQAGRRRLLRVTIDLPQDELGAVGDTEVTAASHAISAALDASPLMGEAPYVLEVSSPGIDRPLLERRHWARARRRLVRVTLADGGQLTGRLTEVDDDGLVVDERRLAWAEVVRGAMQVDFSGVPADDEETDD